MAQDASESAPTNMVTAPHPNDVAFKYERQILRGMVNWGDEVFDHIIAGMGAEHRDTLERMRSEMMDPLRHK